MLKETIETAKLIKNAFDTVGKLNDDITRLKELGESNIKAVELTQIAINLQQLIISLQKDLWALQVENRELEEQLSKTREFEIEKDQYIPFQFSTGAFVYRSNKGITNANGETVFYYLCSNCFNQGKKSVLQPSPIEGYFEMLTCHHCSAKYQYKRIEMEATVVRTRSSRWDGY
ncbi:hypothetical protein NYR72_07930 [Actinobacillus equuli subsp. haemolyticus]|uniref:hypothetical protein n=1 Tax=Actinobacillus equuli TaxID=718 RepID=UPI002418792A|nr:hypothetical protein [Actinobacillus equuli]MDG4948455.1 hypothetical protein [Actinobacillus equuli subsp. haemolyticus]